MKGKLIKASIQTSNPLGITIFPDLVFRTNHVSKVIHLSKCYLDQVYVSQVK